MSSSLDTTILTNSPDLDFLNGRWVGLRFADVHIPPGSAIVHARVQFTAAVSSAAGALTVQIRGEAADTAPAFGTGPNSLSNLPATASSVQWNLPTAWTAGRPAPTSSARLPPVCGIINRPGWADSTRWRSVQRVAGSVLRQAFSQEGRPQAAALLVSLPRDVDIRWG